MPQRIKKLALDHQHLIKEFGRFVVVGVVNTCGNYFIFWLLLTIGLNYLIAGAIGFMSGAVIGFILNRKWTFKSNINYKSGMAKYLSVQIFCLAVHSLTQFSVTHFFGLSEILSQLPGIVITTFLNFFLVRKLIFR